ncbi:MAG: hypothetical protein Q7S15_00390 [bacterium]|nr:hypothetical protein [bacterium]
MYEIISHKFTNFFGKVLIRIDEVERHGYVDSYCYRYPSKREVYTYWDMKTASRERNIGWRIDYFFVSSDLAPKIREVSTYPQVLGSDHCPIGLEIELGRGCPI